MRVRFRKEGADPACGLMPSLPSPRPASSVCDRGSSTGSSSPQGPMLNAILCARHPEILNHFISEPVFCKRSPMGQWSVHGSSEDRLVARHTCTCLEAAWGTGSRWLRWELGPNRQQHLDPRRGQLACPSPEPVPEAPAQTLTLQPEHCDRNSVNFLSKLQNKNVHVDTTIKRFRELLEFFKKFDSSLWRLPWWRRGEDSVLPMQGARVRSLVRELDPTCRN